MSNITAVVFGCILTAALAIYMDQMVHLFELAAARRSRALAGAATLGFAVVVGIGLYEPILRVLAPAPVIVASAPFTEQFVLSEVMASLAQKEGLQVDQRQAMYETIQFEALKRNRIDCCVNYTGNIWVTIMRKDMATGVSQEEMYAAIAGELAKHDIVCAGKLGFQNNYVFAVDRRRAKGITRISELGHMKHQNQYVVAGDEQFFNRPEWRQVREAYRLKFRDIKQMDVSLIYGALEQNQVQVICAYSSDGRLSAKDILVLEDDAHVLPSYDAILLYSRKGAANAALRKSLAPLTQQRLDDDTMRAANLSIDVGVGAKRKTPREAALDVLGKLDS
jgi:osmoprotectant transport system permease protein